MIGQMPAGATVMMDKLRPFWGRVMLVESHVDEEQLKSGLIVPISDITSDLSRGVVQHIDKVWHEATSASESSALADALVPGTVVYYRNGWKIGDVIVVEMSDIIAIEVES